MKQTFALIVLTVFLLLSGGSIVLAAGQPCCDSAFSYSSSDGLCRANSQSPVPPRNSACGSGEVCVGTGRGVCSEPGGGTITCCDSGFTYQPSDGLCHANSQSPVPPRSTNCPAGQQCGGTRCVIGTVTTNTPSTSFNPFAGCSGTSEINTAIGCIPTDPQGFVAKLLGFGVGMAGGIAFLLIILGGFQILTSAGNPERLQGGRELVGAAISGLLLIIFSLFLLRLIGFNILGIPDFG